MPDDDYRFITYETLDDGTIARIMLDRSTRATRRTAGCWSSSTTRSCAAEADDTVRVVILGGNGPMFSSGHDLGSRPTRWPNGSPGPTSTPRS